MVLEFRLLLLLVPVVLVAGIATRGLPAWCALALVPGALAVYRATQAKVGLDGLGWTRLLIGSVRLHSYTALTVCAGFFLAATIS